MNQEVWTIKAKLRTPFIIREDQCMRLSEKPHEAIKNMLCEHEYDKDNKPTEILKTSIDYIVQFEGDKPEAVIVADLGRDVISRVVSLLSFLSRCPIQIVGPPAFDRKYPRTKKHRSIVLGTITHVIDKQTISGDNVTIMNTQYDDICLNAIEWFIKGIADEDIIGSFSALEIALEILTNKFECSEVNTRICMHCKEVDPIKPSTRQKVKGLFERFGIAEEERFKSVWESRNSIMHGGFRLTSEKIRELHDQRNDMALIVTRAIKSILDLKDDQSPDTTQPFWLYADPITDNEWIEP